jgi:hypothetical protein
MTRVLGRKKNEGTTAAAGNTYFYAALTLVR